MEVRFYAKGRPNSVGWTMGGLLRVWRRYARWGLGNGEEWQFLGPGGWGVWRLGRRKVRQVVGQRDRFGDAALRRPEGRAQCAGVPWRLGSLRRGVPIGTQSASSLKQENTHGLKRKPFADFLLFSAWSRSLAFDAVKAAGIGGI